MFDRSLFCYVSIFETVNSCLQSVFDLFDLYAQSVEMNDNVVRMAKDMLRSLNLPAKLIQRPQGNHLNLILSYSSLCSSDFMLQSSPNFKLKCDSLSSLMFGVTSYRVDVPLW